MVKCYLSTFTSLNYSWLKTTFKIKIHTYKEVHVQTLNFFKSELQQTYKLPFTNPLEENQNDIESWFISGFITLGEYLYLCRYNRKLNKEIMTIGK